MASRLEAWVYAGLVGARTIQIQDTGAWAVITLLTSVPIADALSAWEQAANAHADLSGVDYAFGYNADTGVVTLEADVTFSVRFYETAAGATGLAALLGFASTLAGSSSYTATTTPGGLAVCPVGFDAPMSAGPVELRAMRWGRRRATAWHSTKETTLRAFVSAAQLAAIQAGPLLSGRTRVFPTGYTSGAYATDNLRGYLDCYPCGDVTVESFGDQTEASYLVTTRAVVG